MTLKIRRDQRGIIHVSTTQAAETKDLAEMTNLAASAYGFLVQRNETLTAKAFAERIAQHYSCDNPRTRAVVQALYTWVENPPFKCEVCGWHIEQNPALRVGEYTLCANCAEDNVSRIAAVHTDFPASLAELALRDGIEIHSTEKI